MTIFDGPAALSETTRAVILGADSAIIPYQPTGVDLESASDTVRLIHQAQQIRRGGSKAVMFVDRAVKGTRLKDKAIEVLCLMLGDGFKHRHSSAPNSGGLLWTKFDGV